MKAQGYSLERILQSQGFGVRKHCRSLIRQGRVQIGGGVIDDPFQEFATQDLEFHVDGVLWLYRAKVYIWLNKPAGYECSRSPRHHPGILSLLPEPIRVRGVQPVGRLDEDTTGLLLLSDDGDFIHHLISPKSQTPKIYQVTTKHPIEASLIQALQSGVVLHDAPEPVTAVSCVQLAENRLELTLTEGKYHQVKRMIAAAGNRVMALARVQVGGLRLPENSPSGAWQYLSEDQVRSLNVQALMR